MISTLLYTPRKMRQRNILSNIMYYPGEIKQLLKLYGLSTIAAYSSTSKEEYKLATSKFTLLKEHVLRSSLPGIRFLCLRYE
jgi:hypothetical protein